jgi:hypothetical protein
MKIRSNLGYSTQQNYHSKQWSNKSLPCQAESLDHQTTTTRDSSRNCAHKNESKQNHEKTGSTKPQEKRRQESRE